MAINPIKPSEAVGLKTVLIPDEVMLAFNEMIAQNMLNGRSEFTLKEVIDRIASKGISRAEIQKNHWLDIEDVYRAAGWKVVYDVPAMDEHYDSKYIFTVK
jgi:metal-responsive CopG/Arc/MetJ family transcriptional regulator